MKKFFTIFFVVQGILFFVLFLILAFLFVFDPFELKSMFSSTGGDEAVSGSANIVDKNPGLTADQEKKLETFGIDPAQVPTRFTDAQIQCFVEKLGQARVDEIKAGSSPTATEFFKAKDCI